MSKFRQIRGMKIYIIKYSLMMYIMIKPIIEEEQK